jgi:hypothetical protein
LSTRRWLARDVDVVHVKLVLCSALACRISVSTVGSLVDDCRERLIGYEKTKKEGMDERVALQTGNNPYRNTDIARHHT